jgi:hypothetical protein
MAEGEDSMASGSGDDFFKMLEFGFKGCALVVGLIVLPFVIVAHKERCKKQTDAMSAKARELGFEFSAFANSKLARMVRHLDSLDVNNGKNRYALNVVEGNVDGHPVAVFDFHYATSGDWWWPPEWTIHNYVSIVLVDLEREFPELTIGPEGGGLFKRIAEAFGGGDIDFESHEFSRKFDVRSKDKKFAYDFCNAQMIECLLDKHGVSLEVDNSALAMGFENMHDVSRIKPRIASLVEIRSRMPNYLFADADA